MKLFEFMEKLYGFCNFLKLESSRQPT